MGKGPNADRVVAYQKNLWKKSAIAFPIALVLWRIFTGYWLSAGSVAGVAIAWVLITAIGANAYIDELARRRAAGIED